MLYAIIGILVIIADQWVKWWVSAGGTGETGFSLIPGVLSMVNVHNDGAAFSFLAGSNARIYFIALTGIFTLLVIIALAALNGMAWDISMKKPQFMHREIIAMSELLLTNLLFVVIVWLAEGKKFAKGLSSKYIRYDKIDLILPEKREELIADLHARTGLEITSVSIGSIDFLKDMALLKVFYKDNGEEEENTDRLPKGF